MELDLAADEPNALVAIRLNDVQPDGTSTLVTYGMLNLTHRESHEWPEPLEPGAFYRVKVQLNDIAHAFRRTSHPDRGVDQLLADRLAIAEAVILTLRTGNSALYLPVRPPAPEDERLRPFEPPSAAQTARHETLRELPLRRTIEIDLATNETVYTRAASSARRWRASRRSRWTSGTPSKSAIASPSTTRCRPRPRIVQQTVMRRKDWSVRIESRTRLGATRDAFQFSADLKAFEDDEPFGQRSWQLTIPRQLV